jgi:hypothetical protein
MLLHFNVISQFFAQILLNIFSEFLGLYGL